MRLIYVIPPLTLFLRRLCRNAVALEWILRLEYGCALKPSDRLVFPRERQKTGCAFQKRPASSTQVLGTLL